MGGFDKTGLNDLNAETQMSAQNSDGEKATTFQIRKKLRQERNKALQAILAEKPTADAADPQDLEAIAYAETHMGDYKLKSSPNYEVPEGQRINAEKKEKQLLLLEESMHTTRITFNRKVLALREQKLELIKSTQKANQRIRSIDAELGQPEASENLLDPQVVASEWPECRDVYTKADLAAYAAQVTKVGLADARPPSVSVLPEQAEPIKRLQMEDDRHNPAAVRGMCVCSAKQLPVSCIP